LCSNAVLGRFIPGGHPKVDCN
jgi:hypothetical protein